MLCRACYRIKVLVRHSTLISQVSFELKFQSRHHWSLFPSRLYGQFYDELLGILIYLCVGEWLIMCYGWIPGADDFHS